MTPDPSTLAIIAGAFLLAGFVLVLILVSLVMYARDQLDAASESAAEAKTAAAEAKYAAATAVALAGKFAKPAEKPSTDQVIRELYRDYGNPVG